MMSWTRRAPKLPGLYWWRSSDANGVLASLCLVKEKDGHLRGWMVYEGREVEVRDYEYSAWHSKSVEAPTDRRRAHRMRRRLMGLCAQGGCKSKHAPNKVYCDTHSSSLTRNTPQRTGHRKRKSSG